jgi:flagellar hook assembly protein FlgD
LPAANTAPALQAVLHNYPNPFNPTTTIRYTLSDYSVRDLTITIYNARGQKLKESAVTIGESGEGLFTWDGRDDQGKPASSGVYLYSLSADGSELAQQKMLLLK